MIGKARFFVATSSLGLGVAACTSVDGAVDKHGKRVEAKLALLEEVKNEASSRPLATTEGLDQKGIVLHLGHGAGRRTNAALLYLEDLATPEELGNVYGRMKGTQVVAECASFARHKTFPWDPRAPAKWTGPVMGSELEGRFEDCERLEWVFVVRTIDLALPTAGQVNVVDYAVASRPAESAAVATAVPSGSALAPAASVAPAVSSAASPGAVAVVSGTRVTNEEVTPATCTRSGASCTFGGGSARYEVLVFGLAPVKWVGSFVFEAESSDRVAVRSGSIEDDFAAAAQKSFRAALERQAARVEVVE